MTDYRRNFLAGSSFFLHRQSGGAAFAIARAYLEDWQAMSRMMPDFGDWR
jgi:hypothetical protein